MLNMTALEEAKQVGREALEKFGWPARPDLVSIDPVLAKNPFVREFCGREGPIKIQVTITGQWWNWTDAVVDLSSDGQFGQFHGQRLGRSWQLSLVAGDPQS